MRLSKLEKTEKSLRDNGYEIVYYHDRDREDPITWCAVVDFEKQYIRVTNAKVSKKDKFCKKIGRAISLGRNLEPLIIPIWNTKERAPKQFWEAIEFVIRKKLGDNVDLSSVQERYINAQSHPKM